MNILITGASGYLATNLIPTLLDQHKVFAISRNALKINNHNNLVFLQGSYDDPLLLDQINDKIDLVYHLACSTVPENSMQNPAFDIKSNLCGTLFFLEKIKEKGIEKIVFTSSGGVVYGNSNDELINESHSTKPISSYGISKLLIEKNLELICLNHGIEFIILRIGNLYGPNYKSNFNQGVINIWGQKISREEVINVIGDGKIIRDFIFITDVIEILNVVSLNIPSGVYNIGTGIGTSLLQLIAELEHSIGKKAKLKLFPERKFDVKSNVLCIEKISRHTGWYPKISISEGIKLSLK